MPITNSIRANAYRLFTRQGNLIDSLRKNTVAMGARAFSVGERQGPTADDVRKFTVEDVRQWASESVGIDVKHANKLVDQEINGKSLPKVTKEDLVKLYGIPGGPAIKLMEAINALLNVNTGALLA